METIVVIDTSICTDNLGDEIIMDAVNEVVWSLFPSAYFHRVPSHEALSDRTRNFVRRASLCFIGGTNLLSSRITADGLWRLRGSEAPLYGAANTVCLGTGWNDYMRSATDRSRRILSTALSHKFIHAARDSYTRDHLKQVGLDAVTTSCPTTWSLTPEHCALVPKGRARAAVFTLSAWRPDITADRVFVEILQRHYQTVYFFPQMQDDWEYFKSFNWSGIKTVPPTTEGYTEFLENEDVDFIGTRLHGGIRALQKKRRALILAIDNRATELAKDTNLPVTDRTEPSKIVEWIEGNAATDVRLPVAAISEWKTQFRGPLLTPAPPTNLRRLSVKSKIGGIVSSVRRRLS